MFDAKVLLVMIASPSDVPRERQIIRDCIHEWNAINASTRKIVLLPVGWETHSAPEMGDRPQGIINNQILKHCDLLIGTFWTRMGSPTGKAASGTAEEIEEHLASGKPAMIYFSSQPVAPDSLDPDQYASLKSFKDDLKKRGLIESYATPEELEQKLSRQLSIQLNKHADLSQPTPTRAEGPPTRTVHLSDLAVELLNAGSQDRSGNILFLRHLGGYSLESAGKKFTRPGPRGEAEVSAALAELENYDLISPTSHKREVFRVTAAGYKAADALRANTEATVTPPKAD